MLALIGSAITYAYMISVILYVLHTFEWIHIVKRKKTTKGKKGVKEAEAQQENPLGNLFSMLGPVAQKLSEGMKQQGGPPTSPQTDEVLVQPPAPSAQDSTPPLDADELADEMGGSEDGN